MEDKLTLDDLSQLLATQTGISRPEAGEFLKLLFQTVSEALLDEAEEWVKIKDFGTFKLVRVQARESVDVNSGEKIEIPEHNRLSFTPATALKELVNKPFSHFETTLLNDGFGFEDIPLEEEETDETDDVVPETERTADEPADGEITVLVESTGYAGIATPETRVRAVAPPPSYSKKQIGGIWGVFGVAAAIIGAALLFGKRR